MGDSKCIPGKIEIIINDDDDLVIVKTSNPLESSHRFEGIAPTYLSDFLPTP
jgi:hypothetical protein